MKNGIVTLPYDKLASDLAGTKCKKVLVVLDACYSGKFIKVLNSSQKKKLIVLTACTGNEIAKFYEDFSTSCYTYALLKSLQYYKNGSSKGYIKADTNKDCKVTIKELYAYSNLVFNNEFLVPLYRSDKTVQNPQFYSKNVNEVIIQYKRLK